MLEYHSNAEVARIAGRLVRFLYSALHNSVVLDVSL